MEVYLDNSATTKVLPEVCDRMVKVMCEDYGNPSSLHQKGMVAENYIKAAKKQIASTLKVNEKEILITSGGTESNNLALIGTALANRRAGNHIITTAIEHASVAATAHFLEEQGFRLTFLPVDSKGVVSLKALERALDDETILVSVMHVNNEIGTVQPIDEIAAMVKKKNPSIVFHVDAIQSYGKFVIRPKKENIDLLSVSGHKIHGPKGVGFLYRNEKVKMKPIIYGGGQQNGMRSGTENVPGAAGLGLASELIYQNHEEKIHHLNELRRLFVSGIHKLEGTVVNGMDEPEDLSACSAEELSALEAARAPHIVSVSFDGIRSEVLLHALEERGISVSAGSACSSNKPAVSATLKAIGVKKEYLDTTVRFSFSIFTTEAEIQDTLEVLGEILPMLSRYRRK